jgi:hypothetical protein
MLRLEWRLTLLPSVLPLSVPARFLGKKLRGRGQQ